MAHDHGIKNGVLVKGELVLAEHGESFARPLADLAPVRFKLAGQDLQKGGFTGAIGPDQAVTVAGGEFDVDVLEDYPLAVGKGDVGCSMKLGPFIRQLTDLGGLVKCGGWTDVGNHNEQMKKATLDPYIKQGVGTIKEPDEDGKED